MAPHGAVETAQAAPANDCSGSLIALSRDGSECSGSGSGAPSIDTTNTTCCDDNAISRSGWSDVPPPRALAGLMLPPSAASPAPASAAGAAAGGGACGGVVAVFNAGSVLSRNGMTEAFEDSGEAVLMIGEDVGSDAEQLSRYSPADNAVFGAAASATAAVAEAGGAAAARSASSNLADSDACSDASAPAAPAAAAATAADAATADMPEPAEAEAAATLGADSKAGGQATDAGATQAADGTAAVAAAVEVPGDEDGPFAPRPFAAGDVRLARMLMAVAQATGASAPQLLQQLLNFAPEDYQVRDRVPVRGDMRSWTSFDVSIVRYAG